MTTYGFMLHVEGVPRDADGFEAFCNALYPHAPDSTPGTATIGFDRDAQSLREAIASAIESVHRADPSITVTGIVMDDGAAIDRLLETAAS